MNQLVKKSHELVMGKFSFSLLELRLFSLIVSMIDDRDEDFKTYRIAVKDMMKTFNLKSKTIYAEIQQVTTSMLKKIIVIPVQEEGVQKEIKSTLMSSFKYEVSGRGVIEATFNPILKPYLLQLKSKFLLYNLSNILQISSATSIRIFELLKTFEGVKQKTFSLQELKEILGVENSYSKYSNFKNKILLKSQKDLEMFTDIRFTFKEISENSRRVEKIQFSIHPNTPT
ncbi:replication initiation protein [Chryseobacterium sp. PS-8]|uniref:Replication initiation protein n=1 Tax=Chryseobacterium indicum TaxID=2766954 RepID=A0ABS9C9E6_9FLAO|nr:replication initiation protein [Chryseobacterium sp. PS-8]MCF2221051.1 replication initiation protein [Chryseobacterium sp. PS-8]